VLAEIALKHASQKAHVSIPDSSATCVKPHSSIARCQDNEAVRPVGGFDVTAMTSLKAESDGSAIIIR